MKQTEMYEFVEQYLQALDCEILEKNSAYLTTRLSVKADKAIAGRPYYWMFVERTGAEPQTQTLTFIFDPDQVDETIKGEQIYFGCLRLHQIFQAAKLEGQYLRLYEEVSTSTSTQALIPWLLLNYKISFVSDQKKDIFYPLGFNLINGHILSHFDRALDKFQLTPKIPDYHFTLAPIFSLESAIERIEQHIYQFLEKEDDQWATEANIRLDEEAQIMKSFFSPSEDDQVTLQRRLDEVNSYRPKIEISPINVGLIYLQSQPTPRFDERVLN